MRSSGASGVDAPGFRVGKVEAIKRFSQASLSVAMVAFFSACLFVVYDATRSFEQAFAPFAIEALMSGHALPGPGRMSRASLIGDISTPGEVIAPDQNFVSEEHNATIAGMAARGMIAFSLAGLITLSAARRQKPRRDEENTEAAFAAIKAEQRQLARRYHEEKLKAEAASRAKTNFLAHVSHDIRTPLNHIIGFAELMEHEAYGALGDTRYRDYVQSIKSSGQHLLNSFATILDLVELESGKKALRQEPVLLDEVMDAVARRFRGQITSAGLRFEVGPATGAVLRGDRLGLVRMIGNLVDNAVRFTRQGGTITLSAYAADDGVVIEISDTGIGMSEERLASLSQPFALGDATFTRDGHGPGLGISIARAIAALSGGHLAIDSAPSLGTTVAISLPTDQAAAELAA